MAFPHRSRFVTLGEPYWLAVVLMPMQANANHLGTSRLQPFMPGGERAERLGDAGGGDVTTGRFDPRYAEDIGVAVPEGHRRSLLLLADHPHFSKPHDE